MPCPDFAPPHSRCVVRISCVGGYTREVYFSTVIDGLHMGILFSLRNGPEHFAEDIAFFSPRQPTDPVAMPPQSAHNGAFDNAAARRRVARQERRDTVNLLLVTGNYRVREKLNDPEDDSLSIGYSCYGVDERSSCHRGPCRRFQPARQITVHSA